MLCIARMEHRTGARAWALLACALASVSLQGCAVVRLGRGGQAASATAVPAGEPVKAKHGKGSARELEPLEEARVRASEQPGEPWWPYRMAQLETQAGRRAEAESSLRAALARDSSYAPALSQLSRVLYQQGRHEEALALLEPVRARRVSLPPSERAAVLSGLALHEAALGRDAEARETLSLLSKDERNEAIGVVTYLAARAGQADSAARVAPPSPRGAPESAALHNNRGIALLRASDADGAQREFERAIELDPARAAPYYNLAILERWYRLDTAAATKRFQQYWGRSHADPDSLYAELGHGLPPVAGEGADK